MAKIINVGSKTWSSKKEAEAFYRAILHASTVTLPEPKGTGISRYCC